ncbi:hypothetical protein GF367_04870 [Candidatus Woesearchaeota archaeon]|nr:hypothetical protein [Candidatus Woesearchaeota archaeon]
MATFLDIGFLGEFSIIFTFLLVWVLVYALLSMTKQLGDKKNLNALIALAVAVIVIASPTMLRLVNTMVPWFLIMVLLLFFILFGIKMFTGDKDLSGAVFKDKKVYTWIIVLMVVVLIFSLGNAFGSQTLERGGWDGTGPPPSGGDSLEGTDAFIEETGVGNANVSGSQVATNDFSTNLIHTLFNPKVLGLMLVMLVAMFAMFFISD